MTETEQRRIELLRQTRERYSEKYAPPAIHPRYKNLYKSLYQSEEEKSVQKSSFGIRLFIALLLLGIFAFANQKEMKEAEMVTNEIRQNIWTELEK